MNDAREVLGQKELAYFLDQINRDNPEFWRRIGDVDFKGKTVLDIGCGHGALSVHAARQGAVRVVGVDIDRNRIEFAQKNIELNYPEYNSTLKFQCCPLVDVDERFDIAISKDSFEHIEDLPGMMNDIAARLNDGGLLIAGFSPLYYSPFGDHGRYLALRIPWLPAILPEPVLFFLSSLGRKNKIRSASDVGLNKLTSKRFQKVLVDQGWEPIMLEFNKGARFENLLRALRRIPFLEKFFTVSIYAHLRVPKRSS